MNMDENDFLTFQLYTASKSSRVRRSRLRGWALTTFVFLCLAYLFYSSGNEFLAIYFLVFAGLSATLYPLYSRWRYRRHYLKYIKETYKSKLGETYELEFERDTIRTRDRTGEMRINKSEIEEINEIKDFYFLKAPNRVDFDNFKSKSDDIDKIRNEVMSMAEGHGVKYSVELDWEWR